MGHWPVHVLMVLGSGIHSWSNQDLEAVVDGMYCFSKRQFLLKGTKAGKTQNTCLYCNSSYRLILPQGQASRFLSLFIFLFPASSIIPGMSLSLYSLRYSYLRWLTGSCNWKSRGKAKFKVS